MTSLLAQKRISQSYDAIDLKELYINSNEIFQINIVALNTDKVTVNTIIDGETFASTLLNTIMHNDVIKITTGKTPDYIPFNDKLSAHKVMSIVLEITVPEGLDISVYSTLASLDGTGNWGQTQVNLGRGGCRLEDFSFRESVKINTISGDIILTLPQSNVSAQSRNGSVVIAPGMNTGKTVVLESLHGNINVSKSF